MVVQINHQLSNVCIEKPWLNIYISYENFDNRLLVGVEFKFLKLK